MRCPAAQTAVLVPTVILCLFIQFTANRSTRRRQISEKWLIAKLNWGKRTKTHATTVDVAFYASCNPRRIRDIPGEEVLEEMFSYHGQDRLQTIILVSSSKKLEEECADYQTSTLPKRMKTTSCKCINSCSYAFNTNIRSSNVMMFV